MKTAVIASLLITGLLSSSAHGQAPPRPSIRFPANNARVTTNKIMVSGGTRPGSGVMSVQYSIDGQGPFTATQLNANNWNNWEATVSLTVGSNRFQVWDNGPGGSSTSNSVNYFMVATNSISITTSGKGAVAPDLNGKELVIDKNYTILAVPGIGQFFANWSGSITSSDPKLTFLMQSNMQLTATFVANPFTSNNLPGAYGGLFWDTGSPSETNAGYLTLILAGDGILAGQISVDGGVNAFGSRFDTNGAAQLTLHRHNKGDLNVSLTLDLSGLNGLTGSVASDGTNGTGAFAAPLEAYREFFDADYDAKHFDGNYTWAMNGAGNGDSAAAPQGFGYGTATVEGDGHVNLHLFLSDGTTAIASGGLTGNGYLPLYVSLYAGRGSVLGWVAFTNGGPTTNYQAFWFKDPVANGSFTNGFSLTGRTIWLDRRKAPASGANALDITNTLVQLTGGGLPLTLTNLVTLNAKGVASGANTNVVKVSVDNGTGLFTGSFVDPVDGRKVLIKGAALESMRQGLGYFLATNHLSGGVALTAAPAP